MDSSQHHARLAFRSVLVVGGCGFLGQRIVSKLLRYGPGEIPPRIAVLDSDISEHRRANGNEVSYHKADISVAEEVDAILRHVQPQVIFHTATPRPVEEDILVYDRVNVVGTQLLLSAARALGTVKAFIFTSSVAVIDDYATDYVAVTESLPVILNQPVPYAVSKAKAENLVLAANQMNDGGMMTVSLRPCGIFGEGDHWLTERFIMSVATGMTRFQLGDGKNLYDFVYVDNVADAHILAAQALLRQDGSVLPEEKRVAGEAFIITNDEPYFFWDFVRKLGSASGFPTKEGEVWTIPRVIIMVFIDFVEWIFWTVSMGKRRPRINRSGILLSILTKTYCIDKARTRLGYKPTISIVEGIDRCGKWFRSRTH